MADYDYDDYDSNKLNRSRPALKEGEWACVDAKCAFINAEKRQSCQKCGKGKPRSKLRVGREIGKDAAEKSKGLFSAEDWVCTKCGNVNWARRHMCNICNAPKLADVEVRTGYGGGYMDRQDVEYIQRDDDDEEFDEFGRKKKRRKTEGGQEREFMELDSGETEAKDKEEDSERRKQSTEGEDELKGPEEDAEDDEEDDEEVDLDKYDLTADAELASFKVNLELLRKRKEREAEEANEQGRNGRIEVGEERQTRRRSQSVATSDCSCSCSGGECSCVESGDETKKQREDELRRDDGKKHRSRDREEAHRHHNKDRDKHGTSRDRDKGHRERERRERSKERDRHRERDSREQQHRGAGPRERRSRERDRDHGRAGGDRDR